ncbi:MAG: TetR/AcrR family transcriptional regulator [Cyanobacteria bacterium J06623_5]
MSRETYLPVLFQLFRHHGYDGVSLSKIAEATGLGKASLYHHFPGGKAEMIRATLDYSEQWLDNNILKPLQQKGDALTRLQQMCDRLNELYAAGEQPCLIAALTTGTHRDIFHEQVKQRLNALVEAIASVLTVAGMSSVAAHQRGEDAVITIQGALILSRGLDNPKPFKRAIAQLPKKLCEGLTPTQKEN